jgi:hypothetical protein
MLLGGYGIDVKVTRYGCGLDVGWVLFAISGLNLAIQNISERELGLHLFS